MADPAGWAAWLAEPTARRCWLMELDAFGLAAETADSGTLGESAFGEFAFGEGEEPTSGFATTHYFASQPYTSAGADTPANTYYEPRLVAGDVERAILGPRYIGRTRTFARLKLANVDGGLDTLLTDYALDGRQVRLLLGDPATAKSAFGTVFTGVVAEAFLAFQTFEVVLSDGMARLDVPLQTAAFGGTGGADGGSHLTGQRIPVAYGKVLNVSPPLTDTATLLYRVHDDDIADVEAVYDRGIALTEVVGAPASGQYQQTLSPGYFKLGATPAGTVTAELAGSTEYGAGRTKHGQIIEDILLDIGFTAGELDATSFSDLNTAVTGAAGYWAGHADGTTAAEAVDELLLSCGAFLGALREGDLAVGRVVAPSGTPALELDETSILEIETEVLPDTVRPAVWRVEMGYERNWTVQGDLASGVSAAQRAFAESPQRIAAAQDTDLASRHRLARVLAVAGLWDASADAATEAARLLALWGAERKLLRLRVPLAAAALELGDVITLTHSRFGLSGTRPGLVVGQGLAVGGGPSGDHVILRVLV